MQRAIFASWIAALAFRASAARHAAAATAAGLALLVGWPHSMARAQAPAGAAPVPAASAANKPAPLGATAATAAHSDGDDFYGPALPGNYQPPRKPLDVMAFERAVPLMTEQDEEDFRKRQITNKFANILRNGDLSAKNNRGILQDGAKWSVYRLSMPKHRAKVHELRDKLVFETNNAGQILAGVQPDGWQQARQFREFYLKEITARAAELLDDNFHVRINAVILLSELTIKGDASKNIPDEAFTDAAPYLIKVIDDKDQPEAVKIHAVRGLARILAQGKPNVDLKLQIGKALTGELKRSDTHFWYQMRLAEALGWLDSVIDRNRQAYVAQALMEVMVDKNRHCMPRSEAARSIGRIPLEGDVNVGLVAFEIVHLAEQLAGPFDKNPDGIYWRDCYFKIYLAFKPRDFAAQNRGDGLLTKVDKPLYSKHKAVVADAYAQALPLVQHVVASKEPAEFKTETMTRVINWLKEKQPSDYRVAPNLTPLTAQDGASPPAANKPPG